MSSLKQIEANRRNALKSTGPTTEEGKEHSRCNAVRHGLTARAITTLKPQWSESWYCASPVCFGGCGVPLA